MKRSRSKNIYKFYKNLLIKNICCISFVFMIDDDNNLITENNDINK
jgi:hypothetical protein